jgi:hypothetical protein
VKEFHPSFIVVYFKLKKDFYIKSGNGPSIVRNIFENVEYDEYEKQ